MESAVRSAGIWFYDQIQNAARVEMQTIRNGIIEGFAAIVDRIAHTNFYFIFWAAVPFDQLGKGQLIEPKKTNEVSIGP